MEQSYGAEREKPFRRDNELWQSLGWQRRQADQRFLDTPTCELLRWRFALTSWGTFWAVCVGQTFSRDRKWCENRKWGALIASSGSACESQRRGLNDVAIVSRVTCSSFSAAHCEMSSNKQEGKKWPVTNWLPPCDPIVLDSGMKH